MVRRNSLTSRQRSLLVAGSLLAVAAALAVTVRASAPPRAIPQPDCAPGRRLAIVQANLSDANTAPGRATAWLRAQDADLLFLQEAKGKAAGIPAQLASAYPYQLACHPHVPCSTLVLSRRPPLQLLPLARGDVENRQGLSAALMRTTAAGGSFDAISVHLSRPWPWGRQQSEAAALANVIQHRVDPLTILAGDFNAVERLAFMQLLAKSSGLAFATAPGASWPSWPLLGIDHVLVGTGWHFISAERGPDIGSDHRPQLVRLCRAGRTKPPTPPPATP